MPKKIEKNVVIGNILHEWSIPEYDRYDRNKFWYIVMFVLGILFVVYAIWSDNFLFALIVAILKSFELSSQSLFILFCFLSIFLNAIYIRKFTDFYYLAFLFYISHGLIFKEWIGLRMGLASAMVLPIIYY